MIDSLKIRKLILDSNKVILTAHKNIDPDALGSILGMYYLINNIGKNIEIVIDDSSYSPEVKRALDILKENKITPSRYSDIKESIDEKTLLIVTDVNSPKRVQNEKLLLIKNKIVIDHHIESEESKIETENKFIDVTASSATEMIMHLLNELNIYIPSFVATIMLAGMYIDTNGFLLKTTEKTHLCVSSLYKFGANTIEAGYLLKQNFKEYEKRQKLILKSKFYDKYAIVTADSKIYSPIELAKTCDVLLTFNNVEAAFVIGKVKEKTVGISARSVGNINVEEIMDLFGGGGHRTDAAAQIRNKSINKVKKELIKILGGKDESNIY